MGGLGFFVFIAIIIAIVFAISSKMAKQTDEAWSLVARQLGLHFTAGGMLGRRRLGGLLHGNGVHVDTFTRGSGKSSKTYTRYRVIYPEPLRLGLRLSRQGFFSGLASYFGAQDIEVGDAAFDSNVVVKGVDPERVIGFLTPARRLRIHRFLTSFAGGEVRDGEVYCETRGMERSASRIISILQRMSSLSSFLAGDQADDEAINRAMTIQRAGDLDEALEMVRQLPEQTGKSSDVQMLKGEILYTGGHYREAAQIFEQVRQAEPEDPEATGWAARATQMARSSVPPQTVGDEPDSIPVAVPAPQAEIAAPQTPPVTQPGAAGPLTGDVAAICEDLFKPGRMSFESNELFEKQYLDRQVCWSGKLSRVTTFSFDTVFGDTRGTKAVFEIHQISSGPYGGKTIQAVAQLPADAADALRLRTGETMTFQGRLVRCDAFMSNLFLADAQLLE